MENFKGTKGKWINYGGDNSTIDLVLPNDSNISMSRYSRYSSEFVMERYEMEANAQLISHAPEMLELLNELMNNKSFTSHLPTTALKVKDLIRRAITI